MSERGLRGPAVTDARDDRARLAQTTALWARTHFRLWIAAAGSIDALVTLVVVLIAIPGQSGSIITLLILVLLVLLLLSIGLPIAGFVLDSREREGERNRDRLERIDRLLIRGTFAGLPRLSELSDDLLGVTPTRYSIGGSAPYVTRGESDDKIRHLLAAPGPPYPFVIVWGNVKAGKSRTLAEALRATFSQDPLVVLPRDEQSLAELVHLRIEEVVTGSPAVVVLDDLSPSGLDALTPELLERVRLWAVIAATMTAQRRADVLRSGDGVGAIARSALASASGEYELPSDTPADSVKVEAERLYPDERLLAASPRPSRSP